jgi:23S rRNA (pseudouridine1915-N3)-methyltransferase
MKLKLVCVGKIKGPSLQKLIKDYSERISYDAKLEIIEIKDYNSEEEGKKIIELIDRIKDNKFVFALSEEGKEYTSVEFSEKIKKIDLDNKVIIFIIGGPFGLSQEVKKKAHNLFSLSRMTLTHEIARLFLLEQIYRAISIIKNKNYHKE